MKYFKKGAMVFFAMVLAVSLTACATQQAALTKQDLVAQARSKITEVKPTEVQEMVDKGAVVLDVREPSEYESGHIPGAINLPRGLLEFKIAKTVPEKESNIVVYCKTGGRGSLATRSLLAMGYGGAVSIEGGFKGWTDAGGQVVK